MFNIDRDKLKKEIEKVNLQSNSIKGLIGKFLIDPNISEQKKLELCQTGKFLTLFDNKVEILEQFESPDFIISFDGKKIGLEHELIMNKRIVKQIQSTKNLFKQAACVFKEKHPSIKISVDFWLKNDTISFNQKNKQVLIEEIVNYTYSLYQKIVVEKPDFIKDVRITTHSQVLFYAIQDNSLTESLDNSTLTKAIQKKEALIDKYRLTSNLNKQWLLIVIGRISPDSYDIEDANFSMPNSKFERIYLFEDYKANVYRIK